VIVRTAGNGVAGAPQWLMACISAVLCVVLGGCASQDTRYGSPNRQNARLTPSATAQPAAAATPAAATAPLAVKLDIGVDIFDPGIDTLEADQRITTPSVRRAEAHYMPKVLADTLSRRGVWGAVRVIPHKQTEMDLWVDGRILHSDGTRLELDIKVTDATGRPWFSRKYDEKIERYAYDTDPTAAYRDPFQSLYERIADDLQQESARQDPTVLQEIRAVTQLQFAERFAPEQFGQYLKVDEKGGTRIQRLPALDDPALLRMADLRARDLTFVDRIDEYVGDYSREMQPSYDRWRMSSHTEVTRMKELKTSGVLRKIGGALAVLGGIAAMSASNSAGMGAAGVASMAGGAYLFGSGVEKSREAVIHEAALEELADSFGTGMKPHHIELSNRSITLSGTVDEQYAQWRGLLADLYRTETGTGTAGDATSGLPVITTDSPAATTP